MKSVGIYLFRVLSTGLAAIVTFQIAVFFPGSEGGKYFSFMGFTYILSTLLKMGQAYRYLNHKVLEPNDLLNFRVFFRESIILTGFITAVSYAFLKAFELLFSAKISVPNGHIELLCVCAFLLAILSNNAEYKKVTGDAFGYILYSNFLINIFNLFVFLMLYLTIKNLKAHHAIFGFLVSLAGALIISLCLSLGKANKKEREKDGKAMVPLLIINTKAGFIFMLYELSEHLQAWAVPLILTFLKEYSIIVEYRLAFRMLALISFVPLIVNSEFSRTFGTLINSRQHQALTKVLHQVIKKTALGAGIALLIIYCSYPVVRKMILFDKYTNLMSILIILTFGFVVCAVLESSTIILNLQGDKRMLPFFLNIFIFMLVCCSGFIQGVGGNFFIIVTSFSMAMCFKGLVQYYELRKKLV